VNPSPSFTKPTVPHTQAIGAVTIALTAEAHYADKYTLTATRNGAAVAAPASVQSGSGQVATNQIDIPVTGTGDLVIAAAYFNNLGAGDYALKVTANDYNGLPGTGEATVSFTLTGTGEG